MSQVKCCPAWDLWHPRQRCDTAWHRRSMQIGPNLCREAAHRILHRVLLNSQHILQAHILSASLKRIQSPAKPSSNLWCHCLLTLYTLILFPMSRMRKDIQGTYQFTYAWCKGLHTCSMYHCTVQVIFLKISSAAHSWVMGLCIHGKLQASVAACFFVNKPILYTLLPKHTKYVCPWAVLNICKWCPPWIICSCVAPFT